MAAYLDRPAQPRNLEFHARHWNPRSDGWASTNTGGSDPLRWQLNSSDPLLSGGPHHSPRSYLRESVRSHSVRSPPLRGEVNYPKRVMQWPACRANKKTLNFVMPSPFRVLGIESIRDSAMDSLALHSKSAEHLSLCRRSGVIPEDEPHVFNTLQMARCLHIWLTKTWLRQTISFSSLAVLMLSCASCSQVKLMRSRLA